MEKIKKLRLNKEVIANLNNVEMNQIKGGAYNDTLYDCFTRKACGNNEFNTGNGSGGNGTATCPSPPKNTTDYGVNTPQKNNTWDGCQLSREYCGSESQGCMYTDPYW